MSPKAIFKERYYSLLLLLLLLLLSSSSPSLSLSTL